MLALPVQSVYSADMPPETAGTLTGWSMAPGAASAKTPALRYWRVQRTLLQQELAQRAGVHYGSISRGESGQALRLLVIRKLAEALDVEPTELMRQPPTDAQ